MSSVFGAGATRIVAIFGIMIFVCFQVRTIFDNKEINIIITKPISRASLVASFVISYAAISLMLCAFLAVLIFAFSNPITNGALLWLMSLFFEMIIVALISLFASLMLRSAVACVMFSASFYVLARMMGFLLATVDSKKLFDNQYANMFFEYLIQAISIVVPRFDLFSHSSWLIYETDYMQQITQIAWSLIFLPFIILLIIIDFSKKEF